MNPLSRRTFLKILSTAVTIPLLSKCSTGIEPLRISSHVWSGYELMFLAQREGWLSSESVNLIDVASATESIEKLASNQVDGAALTLDEVLRARAQGIPLTCVLVFDVSAGADMLLTKTPLKNLNELAGKRIGVETSAVGSLMLYKLLEAAKLNKSDVIPVELKFNQHIDAWNQEKIDAVITFEPIASQLLNQGAYKSFDSRKLPGTIFDVLAVKSNALEKYEKQLKHLVSTHFRARNYFYRNTQDAAYKMAIRMKLSAPEVLNSFRGLNLPNEQANQDYLAELENNSLINTATILSALMLENGTITQPDNLVQLFSADFLPKNP